MMAPGSAGRSLLLVLLLCAGVLTIPGCRRPTADARGADDTSIFAKTQFSPQPVHLGAETLDLSLTDAAGQPVRGATIRVEGDMAHPGMAPIFSDARETAPGSYAATVNFTMGGDWVVLLHIRLADGRRAEKQIAVRGVLSL